MADQIGVQIVAADQQFIAATKATASAMSAVVAQEEKLSKAATAAGLDQKKFSTTFKALEKQRVAQETKASKDRAATEKKTAADAIRNSKSADAKAKKARKDEADASAKRKQFAKEESDAMYAAAGGIAAAVVAVGTAASASLLMVAKLAIGTKEVKDNTVAMLDVLTNGRGDKTLRLLDSLAGQLGQKVQDVRDNFIEFRKAGLGNKQSTQLLKLVADLKTVDKSGSLAQQAIDRVLSYASNGPQTKDQVAAQTKVMALLAKQAHVAGDGTLSAAAAATTLTGALNRIDNSKTKALETIGDKIQPSVDKAASAVAGLVEKFLDSKRGQAALQLVSDAISGVADAVTAAVPYVDKLGGLLDSALANPVVRLAIDGLKGVLYLAAGAAVALAVGAGLLLIQIEAVGAAALLAIGGLTRLVKGALDIGPDMWKAGSAIVDGLIDGIKDGAVRLAKAVSNIAGSVKDGFKNALGIHSPSRVFDGYGVNIGAGLNKGLDRSMPEGPEMAQRMLPAPEAMGRAQSVFQMPPPIFGTPSAARSSGGSDAPQIVINLQGGATEGDAKRIRKEIDLWWMSKQQQQGMS